MAIFRTSPLIGGISGSVGGVQFLSGAGGNVVRARAGKRSQKTPAMLNEQAIYINAVRHWQGLTAVQRRIWNSLIQNKSIRNRLGVPQHLPGFQSFMKAGIPNFHAFGFYPNAPAPGLITQPAIGYTFSSQTAAAINFTINNLDPFATINLLVYVGFSVNHPVWTSPRRRRLVFAGAYDATPEVKLIPTWPGDFALPVTGWRIFIETRLIAPNARPGASTKADFIVG